MSPPLSNYAFHVLRLHFSPVTRSLDTKLNKPQNKPLNKLRNNPLDITTRYHHYKPPTPTTRHHPHPLPHNLLPTLPHHIFHAPTGPLRWIKIDEPTIGSPYPTLSNTLTLTLTPTHHPPTIHHPPSTHHYSHTHPLFPLPTFPTFHLRVFRTPNHLPLHTNTTNYHEVPHVGHASSAIGGGGG